MLTAFGIIGGALVRAVVVDMASESVRAP